MVGVLKYDGCVVFLEEVSFVIFKRNGVWEKITRKEAEEIGLIKRQEKGLVGSSANLNDIVDFLNYIELHRLAR